MKKAIVLSIVIALLALLVSIFAGGKVEQQRLALKSAPAAVNVYMPRLGLDKFIADVRWVLLIQQMGRAPHAGLTREDTDHFAGVLENITNMDPDFSQAYLEGALFIAHQAPDRAVKLLEKASRISSIKDWKLDFYRGFIAEKLLSKTGTALEECQAMAEKAYEAAAPTAPGYVARSWMRMATRQAGSDPIKQLVAQKDFITALWKKTGSEYENVPGNPEMPTGMGSEYFGMENNMVVELAQWVNKRAGARMQILIQSQKKAADAKEEAAILAKLETVRQVFDAVHRCTVLDADADHFCKHCLTPYGPAEFFCSKCGKKVEAYDYCTACWKNGKRVVLTQGFCPVCGNAATPSKKVAVKAGETAVKPQ